MAGSWISFSQTLRSNAVPSYNYSPTLSSRLPANRITTAAAAVTKPPAPWLMLKPLYDGLDNELMFKFYCCATEKIYVFGHNEYSPNPTPEPELYFSMELVGSSHGWLALFDPKKRELLLSDPISGQHVKLPPLDHNMGGEAHALILAEEEGEAFLIYGPGGSLASCSPGRSHGWTIFGGGGYESVVYSSTHRRLLCLTSAFGLEAWDVGGESPKLDWAAQFDSPAHRGPEWKMLKYIVCSGGGELFVVVRHVKTEISLRSLVEQGRGIYIDRMDSEPSVDFEVYKVNNSSNGEGEWGLMRMEDSLEGMAMFVGMNNPIAMKDADGVVGVKPNSIYYGYDKREDDEFYRRLKFGIFDYRKGGLIRYCTRRFNFIDHGVDQPVWFTPRRLHTI